MLLCLTPALSKRKPWFLGTVSLFLRSYYQPFLLGILGEEM